MPVLSKIQSILESMEKWIIVLLLSVMILFSFLQVILRDFFSTGFLWGDILLRHMVLWVGFFGACIAVKREKHFAIDIIRKKFAGKIKIIINIAIDIFILSCLFFLCGAALKFFKDDYTSKSVLFSINKIPVPAFWLDSIIPLGFILLFIHYFLKSAENLLIFFSGKKQNGMIHK